MKKILILIISIFIFISCGGEEKIEKIEEPKIPDLSQTLQTCKEECGKNAQLYCLGKKTFLNRSREVTGTCRSFSKYNIGFPKCKGFCRQFGKNKDRCLNKDGSLNERCN